LLVTAIFVIFALSLFGAYEIQLPSGLLNKLNAKSGEGSGIISILLMALTFSVTSFACTAPFVGAALVAASDGEWFYPIVGMLGFSGVLAAPFFLLALFPAAMKKMPKSGG
jgi:thiol:disulfide interchange protein DsbD